MKLPTGLAVASILRRGVILHNEKTSFASGATKAKFLIVVGVDPAHDPALFVVATSQTDFYDRHPNITAILRIPVGGVPSFPKATIIDCRELLPHPAATGARPVRVRQARVLRTSLPRVAGPVGRDHPRG